MKNNKGLILLLDSAHGTYIPQIFAENLLDSGFADKWHIQEKLLNGMKRDENEFYWDDWEIILNSAYFVDDDGYTFHLHQDGDLWAYCQELLTDDELLNLLGE